MIPSKLSDARLLLAINAEVPAPEGWTITKGSSLDRAGYTLYQDGSFFKPDRGSSTQFHRKELGLVYAFNFIEEEIAKGAPAKQIAALKEEIERLQAASKILTVERDSARIAASIYDRNATGYRGFVPKGWVANPSKQRLERALPNGEVVYVFSDGSGGVDVPDDWRSRTHASQITPMSEAVARLDEKIAKGERI